MPAKQFLTRMANFYAQSCEQVLATESLYFIQYAVEYIANCQHRRMEPKKAVLKEMGEIFVQRGANEVHKFVLNRFPEFSFSEYVAVDETGMKIRSTEIEKGPD